MSYEYVKNERTTTKGWLLRVERASEDLYILKVQDEAYRGLRQYNTYLSKDDVKALYLMLDDIVGTF